MGNNDQDSVGRDRERGPWTSLRWSCQSWRISGSLAPTQSTSSTTTHGPTYPSSPTIHRCGRSTTRTGSFFQISSCCCRAIRHTSTSSLRNSWWSHAYRSHRAVYRGPQTSVSIDSLALLLPRGLGHAVICSSWQHTLGFSDGLVPRLVGVRSHDLHHRPTDPDVDRIARSDRRRCRGKLFFAARALDLACRTSAPVASASNQRALVRLERIRRHDRGSLLLWL